MDILATNETFSAPMDATYSLLGVSPGDVTTLEQYLQVCAHGALLAVQGNASNGFHQRWSYALVSEL